MRLVTSAHFISLCSCSCSSISVTRPLMSSIVLSSIFHAISHSLTPLQSFCLSLSFTASDAVSVTIISCTFLHRTNLSVVQCQKSLTLSQSCHCYLGNICLRPRKANLLVFFRSNVTFRGKRRDRKLCSLFIFLKGYSPKNENSVINYSPSCRSKWCPYYLFGPWTWSMQGQKYKFHHKYLNLSSEDERMSYGFGTTWGWAIIDRIFIFGWTITLRLINSATL